MNTNYCFANIILYKKLLVVLLKTKSRSYSLNPAILTFLQHHTGNKHHSSLKWFFLISFIFSSPLNFMTSALLPLHLLLFSYFKYERDGVVENNSGYSSQSSFFLVILLNYIFKFQDLYINSMQINFRSLAMISVLNSRLSYSIISQKLFSKYFASSTNSKLWDSFSHLYQLC